LKEAGVNEFLVNTHHLAQMVHAHLQSRSDRQCFTVVYEQDLLGTLGTVRANEQFLHSQETWILHADNYIEGSLVALRDRFRSRPNEMCGAMLTFEAEEPSTCGVVVKGRSDVVTGFFEKVSNPPSSEASAATFIFDSRLFDAVRRLPLTATDLSHDLVPRLIHRIIAVPHSGGVFDIGTPEGLLRARQLASCH
jgi:mannose-1-phosphate guanylyltransferase